MSTASSENPVAKPHGTAHRVRVIIFRVVAAPAGPFFVVAVVLMASTPWVPLQPDQDVRTEPNRWFLTVAGSVDAITAGVLLALARRLRRTLLVLELAGAVIVASAIILPCQHSLPSSQSAWCR
jgi:peptidoglycan/LPS O-acetylase OafA/YrhL